MMGKLKIAFITNFCPHYREQTFEILANDSHVDVTYYFFSAGDEWYWQQQHGVRAGKFNFRYLSGFQLGHTRITLSLIPELLFTPYDVIIKCINGKFALPATYLIARLKRKPFILWTGIWTRINTPFHRLIFPFTKYIYRHSDAIVVYGEHVKQYLRTEGVDPEKIFIAAHAIDNPTFARKVSEAEKNGLREYLQIRSDEQIVLFLGRLEKVKGLFYLIDACHNLIKNGKFENTRLVIAGEGSLREKLIGHARELGIQKYVVIPGYVNQSTAVVFYGIADMLVLPSISQPEGKELWGLVVNEAFNQSVPVIASDAVGAAAGGLVQHGINGLVVPEHDDVALAESIALLLDNANLRRRLSSAAYQTINQWTNEKMVAGYIEAINFVHSNRGTQY